MLAILHYIHDQHGVFHHDIKPENFLIFGDELLLADFAMSTLLRPNNGLLIDNIHYGTIQYTCPEYRMGLPFCPRQYDLWSCILCLFNLTTGMDVMYSQPHPNDILFNYFLQAGALTRNFFNPMVQEVHENAEEETRQAQAALDIAIRAYQDAIGNMVHQMQISEQQGMYLANIVRERYAECVRLHHIQNLRQGIENSLAHAMERVTTLNDDLLEVFELGLTVNPFLRATREQILQLRFMRNDNV
jgi:serine/threonine protein kinase